MGTNPHVSCPEVNWNKARAPHSGQQLLAPRDGQCGQTQRLRVVWQEYLPRPSEEHLPATLSTPADLESIPCRPQGGIIPAGYPDPQNFSLHL